MSISAFVTGCEATSLSARERAFLADADPWGLILFQRNCESPDQVRRLTDDFRSCVGRDDAPVLIDQEGGRVQRLKPPHWPAYPCAAQFGALYARDRELGLRATGNCARLIADDLHRIGITVDCLPVLDVLQQGAHSVIGDRAYGSTPDVVSALGRAAMDGLLAGGVLPVMKHVPGHGRATADSHLTLPVVDAARDELEACDFAPFQALSDCPMAMTAHIVFKALDPDHPATQSRIVVEDIIRSRFGFGGLLLSDDITMFALRGTLAERAAACYAAGCDMVIHCNGDFPQMQEIAAAAPQLSGESARRAAAALAMIGPTREYDVDEARQDLDRALRESV